MKRTAMMNHPFSSSASSPLLLQRLFLVVALHGFSQTTTHAQQSVTDVFPSSLEEYDLNMLDPFHVYGTPLGGFGRATRHELAQLPLLLTPTEAPAPGLDNNDETFHTTIRDALGRLYVCRVYHEDELQPTSLVSSMFEAPQLAVPQKTTTATTAATTTTTADAATKTTKNDNDNDNDNDNTPAGAAAAFVAPSSTVTATPAGAAAVVVDDGAMPAEAVDTALDAALDALADARVLYPGEEGDHPFQINIEVSIVEERPAKNDPLSPLEMATQGILVHQLEDKLTQELGGLCAQIHQGWWSYEWCYKKAISQFHVEVDKSSVTKNNKKSSNSAKLTIHDITSLGKHVDRHVVVDLDKQPPNVLAGGLQEIARVTDVHVDGTPCGDTLRPRESRVHLQCCSPQVMEKHKGLVHRNSEPVLTNQVLLYNVMEEPNRICHYNLTVCTPLLCVDPLAETRDLVDQLNRGIQELSEQRKKKKRRQQERRHTMNHDSVMDILDYELDGFCIQSNTGGWWTYELCHGNKVRQFHEKLGAKKSSSGNLFHSRTVEAEHNLGNYQTNIFRAIVPEDEWRWVVNATDKGGASKSGATGGSNARPYLELEYTLGDVCDHSDVTDAAVIAGSTTARGIARASSVRYQCGDTLDITVSEDSTCHYIVYVDVPELCQHPLFQVPVAKNQVMKCLLAADPSVEWGSWDDDKTIQ